MTVGVGSRVLNKDVMPCPTIYKEMHNELLCGPDGADAPMKRIEEPL